ncbi:hypothetical protein NVP1259O_21 [Vibrio phage 1.259.O._10N.286.48.F4]|nr:hypothetical protein NVP1259O_21 [Vibrio phage 1.259.O._10N.286.48.F4]
MFDSNKGFVPSDVTSLIESYRVAHVAEWGTPDLTQERFEGSKEYELYYTAAQIDAQQQAYFSQTFEKLKDYIELKNEKIQRPTPINDRIINFFVGKYGFNTSVRQPTLETRGILAICLDYTPDGSTLDQSIANDIKDFCQLGGIWTDGSIEQNTALSNGQSWLMKWEIPTERTVEFKYTIIRSRNSAAAELPTVDIRRLILDNFEARSGQGLDVEPQKYLTIGDLGWASSIQGERRLDGESEFTVSAYQSKYDEKFTAVLDLESIEVIDV